MTPVASWALGKAADTVWTIATDQVQTTLQRTDIERAIKAGVEAVREWEQSLEVPALLFKNCDDKQKRQFLEQVFADAGVVEQLQCPLIGKGEPDIGLLQAYFEQVAGNAGTELTTDSLPRWLQIFSATYVEKTALFTKYEVARQRYLQQLANWYDDVKFLGISVAGQEDTRSERLLQIFVMPDVKPRDSLPREKGTIREFLPEYFFWYKPFTSTPEINPTYLNDKELQEAIEYYHPKGAIRQERLLAEQSAMAETLRQSGRIYRANQFFSESKSRRCVLLGAPGSGKTTLMSYFAVALSTEETQVDLGLANAHLPILVRIRDWVRSSHTNLLDYVRWFATDKLAVKDLPAGFFEHWLEAGKALILLDGLDEVASESRRDEVVNQIECFLQHGAYCHNPAIITSRPAGYKQAYFRTEEFPHYDLQAFDEKKIDQFIQNWYDNRFRDPEESQRRQQTLKKALSERDRIQVLAKNPLLLTIIALIHRQEAYLPRKRHQLYNRAVETLLINWDANKELDYKWPLEYLKRDTVRRMMEQLAYWIHSYGSTGDAEGGTLIDKNELIHQLGRFIAEEAGIKRYQAEAEAQRFLDYIRERTGLLNEQGQDCYAFVHKTFQEYLCAQEIKYRADEEYDEELILTPIREHLHEPHWKEVLLLLIAQQPKKRVAKIIQQILYHPTPYEQWLHRNLFFAAACLSEDAELTDSETINHILNKLMEVMLTESLLVSPRQKQQVENCLSNLGETAFQNQVLQRLEILKDKIGNIKLQNFRLALGQEALAISALIGLLKGSDSNSRLNVLRTFGKLGQAPPEVVQALIACLFDNQFFIRHSAASALGELRQVTPEIVRALITCLCDDDWILQSSFASALSKLVQTSPEVIQELINCLYSGNGNCIAGSAESLRYLNKSDSHICQALLDCLNSEGNNKVRVIVARALYQLNQANSDAVLALIDCLYDQDRSVCYIAMDALGKSEKITSDAVQALTDCLNSNNKSISHGAAETLGELGIDDLKVIQVLVEILEDPDTGDYGSAAKTLGKFSKSNTKAKDALVKFLKDEKNHNDENKHYARWSLAEALGELDNVDLEIEQSLIDCLENEAENVGRYFIADALSKITENYSLKLRLTQLLIDCLGIENGIGDMASESIGKLGRHFDSLETRLADWIEQNQQSKYVGHGIDALWAIMTEQA